MQIVTPQWIKEQIDSRPGLTAKEVALSIGIDGPKMSRILNGERRITLKEAAALIAYFDTSPPAPGFAEARAEPLTPPGRDTDAQARALAPDARHPIRYALRGPILSLSLLAGDVLVIDLGRAAAEGELVLVNSDESGTGDAVCVLRRLATPHLVSLDRHAPRPVSDIADSASHAILGPIVAVFRERP